MRQTKRKIVALSTAFVMAFALVAAMVPTVSEADEPVVVSNVQVTVTNPAPRTTIEDENTKLEIALPDGAIYSKAWNCFINCFPSEGTYDDGAIFGTVMQEGSYYAYELFLNVEDPNSFAAQDAINIVAKDTAGNTLDVEKIYISGTQCGFAFKVKATSGGSSGGGDAVPVKEGDNQTVAPGAPVQISFDKEFSKFENGGAVYLDDSTEPLSTDCYTATSGSTVITLLDSFTKTLKEGAHTLKVKFNDDSVGTATFTVSASANSDGSASGTSGTATSGTSSSAATTTKVAAPKTADVLPFAAIAVVFVGATAIGVIAFRRKNS